MCDKACLIADPGPKDPRPRPVDSLWALSQTRRPIFSIQPEAIHSSASEPCPSVGEIRLHHQPTPEKIRQGHSYGVELRSSPQPYCSFRSGQWGGQFSLGIGLYAAPMDQIARRWRVQDCLWKTFSRIFATMPALLFRLGPMVLSES